MSNDERRALDAGLNLLGLKKRHLYRNPAHKLKCSCGSTSFEIYYQGDDLAEVECNGCGKFYCQGEMDESRYEE